MKLSCLLENLKHEVIQGTTDKSVNSLVYYSEEAVEGSLFFAIEGSQKDGRDYAEDAVNRGATAVAVQYPTNHTEQNLLSGWLDDSRVTVILVEDVRIAMAEISKVFYGNPCDEMLMVGVTGTKGKTSTTFLIRSILEEAGIPTGMIGTVVNGREGHFLEAVHTTPQSVDIQRLCREMRDGGCRAVVVEVSSQGLMHRRVHGIHFHVAVFTNLSPDHIGPGEHSDFKEYAFWKSRLFLQCEKAVYNKDDGNWEEIFRGLKEENQKNRPEEITFGTDCGSNLRISRIRKTVRRGKSRISFKVGFRRFSLAMAGRFNAMNGAAAIVATRSTGIKWSDIKRGLRKAGIPGRLEQIDTDGRCTVLVDYAHNGIALESLLNDLNIDKKGNVILVFGCGGNRDRNRRFEMGRAAAMLADFSVITSDNPRSEPPERIIKDITSSMDEAGVKKETYIVIEDRRSAIGYALGMAGKKDTVLIAGKGHETYQIIGEEKIHFDDREVVRDFVASLNGTAR